MNTEKTSKAVETVFDTESGSKEVRIAPARALTGDDEERGATLLDVHELEQDVRDVERRLLARIDEQKKPEPPPAASGAGEAPPRASFPVFLVALLVLVLGGIGLAFARRPTE